MSKMSSHDPFGHLEHKLWPKERPKVKLAAWLPTIRSQESTRFPSVQVACDITLESSRQELKLCFIFHCNWRFKHKVMGPQNWESPTLGIQNWEFNPETKCHLDVDLVERHKVYYKGEGGGFPKSRLWWVLWVRGCPWLVLASKVFKLCTNQLVVWFV
jgi:hypothetical protein